MNLLHKTRKVFKSTRTYISVAATCRMLSVSHTRIASAFRCLCCHARWHVLR